MGQGAPAFRSCDTGCSTPYHPFVGTLDVVKELETYIARFVGKPAALAFPMGYATNSTNIPALMKKVCVCVCVCGGGGGG